MTWEQVQQHEARMSRAQVNPVDAPVPYDAAELESPLQEQIERECRERQWVCVRTRMDLKNTFTMAGVADLIIAMPDGKTLWCECKSRIGKQTVDQQGFEMMLERLGHRYVLVRSLSQFLEIVNADLSDSAAKKKETQ